MFKLKREKKLPEKNGGNTKREQKMLPYWTAVDLERALRTRVWKVGVVFGRSKKIDTAVMCSVYIGYVSLQASNAIFASYSPCLAWICLSLRRREGYRLRT
jgi:hypothetical protein